MQQPQLAAKQQPQAPKFAAAPPLQPDVAPGALPSISAHKPEGPAQAFRSDGFGQTTRKTFRASKKGKKVKKKKKKGT